VLLLDGVRHFFLPRPVPSSQASSRAHLKKSLDRTRNLGTAVAADGWLWPVDCGGEWWWVGWAGLCTGWQWLVLATGWYLAAGYKYIRMSAGLCGFATFPIHWHKLYI
jgi:hypothetical protein